MASRSHFVEISSQALDLRKYASLVADDGAGAVATFMGVTRDNFDGKEVLKLCYEAYGPMAEKEMEVGSSLKCIPPLTSFHCAMSSSQMCCTGDLQQSTREMEHQEDCHCTPHWSSRDWGTQCHHCSVICAQERGP